MRSVCHLYPGFAHAGALVSVYAQREVQRRFMASLTGSTLLIVGSAFGEEANHLLHGLTHWRRVVAIDVAEVAAQVMRQPVLSRLGSRLECGQCDLLEAQGILGFGSFDLAQCGFVLHDFCSEAKHVAMLQLASAVRPGGHVIVSDIFSSGDRANYSYLSEVYDTFLREAATALRRRRLTSRNFDELLGDGVRPGLLRSREDALKGKRDFLEPIKETVESARCVGLQLRDVKLNPCNGRLAVLVFQRSGNSPKFSVDEEEERYDF